MKYPGFLICFVLFWCAPVDAASLLAKISKAEDRDSIQAFMSFDSVPAYEDRLTGKRLDIVLHDTELVEGAAIFQGNDKIVKILTQPFKGSTVVSFFFRYNPQKIKIARSGDTTLVADILVGNRFSRTYQDFSSLLQGVTILDRQTEDFTNPLVASPYAHDWHSFISRYESAVTVTAPVHFLVPDFPSIRLLPPGRDDNRALLPGEILALAGEKNWDDIIPLLQDLLQTAGDDEALKLLALTHGEVLLRLGNFDGAYKQLYLLNEKYPEEQVGILASYLLSVLLARHGDPYTADYRFRNLAGLIRPDHPLAPYLVISQTETSLATDQLEQMDEMLARDDIALPPELVALRELRQADYRYATGASVKAYVAYQLVAEQVDLKGQPYSLNGLCDTLYEQKLFVEAAPCYRSLAALLEEPEQQAMAAFREIMARLGNGAAIEQTIGDLSKIEDTFAGTEAAFRAALKKTDLRYRAKDDWAAAAIRYYNALASHSIYRAVSEEASFKEALLYHLTGDDTTSIELLITLLRNFRSGPVRPSAEALLIQILPGELQRLVDEQDYSGALALAKQNRRFFDHNWIDLHLLEELAYSNLQLGIYDEALRLYLYLMEIVSVEEKEKFFLPVTQAAFDKGDYGLVEDYAAQYGYNYPDGRFHDTILYLRLSSLHASGQIDKALGLLPEPLPESDQYHYLAASLYFNSDDHARVAALLLPLHQADGSLPANQTFILAESLYQLDKGDAADPLFKEAAATERFAGQSLFRRAQISRARGDEEEALKFLRQIAEKEDSSPWKKLAEQELQLSRLSRNH